MSINTVDKALAALTDAGLIIAEHRCLPTRNGNRRMLSKCFLLTKKAVQEMEEGGAGDEPPCPISWRGGASQEGEHINNINTKTSYKSFGLSIRGQTDAKEGTEQSEPSFQTSPSNSFQAVSSNAEGAASGAGRCMQQAVAPLEQPEDPELDELLYRRMHIDLYDDDSFISAVEMAVRDMWYAPHITVQGERIPQARVRQRLRMMDVHCMDTLADKMRLLLSEDIDFGPRYLISCIYNLPAEVKTHEAAFASDMRAAELQARQKAENDRRRKAARQELDRAFGPGWDEVGV